MIYDRRAHLRNACSIRIVFEDPAENIHRGTLKNLCLGGAYIQTHGLVISRNQVLSLTIPFINKARYLTIKGKVAWTSKGGFAVVFIRKRKSSRQFY